MLHNTLSGVCSESSCAQPWRHEKTVWQDWSDPHAASCSLPPQNHQGTDRRCILVYGPAGVLYPLFCSERESIGFLLWKSYLQQPPLHGDCCWRQLRLRVNSCCNQCHRKREELRKAYYQARDGNSPRNEVRMWGGNSATDVRCSTQHLSLTLQIDLGGVSGPAGTPVGLWPFWHSHTNTPAETSSSWSQAYALAWWPTCQDQDGFWLSCKAQIDWTE